MSAGPAVSVVVPVRNGAAALGRCLTALAAQQGVLSYEVIVVDNGSTDDTAAVARAHPIGASVLTESRVGSYAARNTGIPLTHAPILAFTDADCTPEPNWLAAALATFERTGAALVGGAVHATHSPDPSVWELYDRAVYLRQQDVIENGGWASTANLLVRREVFDAVGLFDASMLSGGDREFCVRAGRAGFPIAYAPDAVINHEPRKTLGDIWRLHRRIGTGFADLRSRGEIPPWWRMREHWMRLDWVIVLISRDGPRLRRRQVLPVHSVAMAARLYGRLRGR